MTIALVCFVSTAGAAILVPHFWRGPTLSAPAVRKRWGSDKFDAAKFKNGGPVAKSKMAADLIEYPKAFLGKTPAEVRAELGDPEGFYFRDSFPAYIIDETPENIWQVVFLLNNEFKVGNIIVHKNCCDQSTSSKSR